jgi:peptidoglycan/LPS O-acetylase OafA/YrhL
MDYRREIDGLRALAVLPVILFHAGFVPFRGGFVGVDVFFVISGYLITTIILAELEQGKFSIVNFYERRARRILPALFLVMLVSIPFAWFWLLPSDIKDFSQSLVAVSLFASNILFWRESGYFDTAAELKPLLHTWSLAVEEQYYVLFPLFLMLFWKLGKRYILVTLGLVFVASLAVAQWSAYAKPAAAFYLLPTRGWELLIGAFAAFYLSKANRKEFGKGLSEIAGWLGFTLILYAVFAYDKTTPFPGFYALVPTIGTVLIILFATQKTTVGKFVGNEAFVGIGLVSYSAYLWHQPLFAFARHRSMSEPSVLVFLALSLCSLVLAYLSWRFIESYFRNKSSVGRGAVFTLSFLMTFGFLLFGLYGHFSEGFKSRLGSKYDQFAFAEKDKNPRQSECHFSKEVYPNPENYCVLGRGKVLGLMLGDSHADALAHPLSDVLSQNNIALKSVTYSGCPPVIGVYGVDQKDQHKCYEINNQSFDYALSNPDIEFVVLLGRWVVYLEGSYFDNKEGGVESSNFTALDIVIDGVKQRNIEERRVALVANQYQVSLKRLLKAGKKIILIYPIPEVGFDVPKRLARMKMLGVDEQITTSYDVFLNRNRRVIDAFDSIEEQKNLVRIRPEQLFCQTNSGGRCVTVKGESILYYDDDHLSNRGSKFIAEEVVKAMLKLK